MEVDPSATTMLTDFSMQFGDVLVYNNSDTPFEDLEANPSSKTDKSSFENKSTDTSYKKDEKPPIPTSMKHPDLYSAVAPPLFTIPPPLPIVSGSSSYQASSSEKLNKKSISYATDNFDRKLDNIPTIPNPKRISKGSLGKGLKDTSNVKGVAASRSKAKLSDHEGSLHENLNRDSIIKEVNFVTKPFIVGTSNAHKAMDAIDGNKITMPIGMVGVRNNHKKDEVNNDLKFPLKKAKPDRRGKEVKEIKVSKPSQPKS